MGAKRQHAFFLFYDSNQLIKILSSYYGKDFPITLYTTVIQLTPEKLSIPVDLTVACCYLSFILYILNPILHLLFLSLSLAAALTYYLP